MRWTTGRRSENIEDRRGLRAAPLKLGGGLGVVALVVIALLLGVNPGELLQTAVNTGGALAPQSQAPSTSQPKDPAAQFISVVLADTEDVWNAQFRRMGERYREPKLVLFSDAVQSACGFAQSAMGPFYCPGDAKVYLDLSFFHDLASRHGAAGDFAQAYVIAHEIGHHVQNLLGILPKVNEVRQRSDARKSNQLSVRLELQADCLAGVWAHHAQQSRHILEPGDLEEALTAASAVGDDRLQRQSQGRVTPDSFTHGTSAQRKRWFSTGFKTGDVNRCDTFSAKSL